MTAQKAANNGARFLDKYDPKWFKKINTAELDLSDGAYCIVGQLNHRRFNPDQFCSELVLASLGEDTQEEVDEATTKPIDTGLRIPGFTVEEHRNLVINASVDVEIDPVAMGFQIGPTGCGIYTDLTEAWLEEIHKRRAAAKTARKLPRRNKSRAR